MKLFQSRRGIFATIIVVCLLAGAIIMAVVSGSRHGGDASASEDADIVSLQDVAEEKVPLADGRDGNEEVWNAVWLFDFPAYQGENPNPGGFLCRDVEMGGTYTFSCEYCIQGESAGTTIMNAANVWGMGSNVVFDTTPLEGKSSYSVTFEADYPQVYPVFQTHVPYGTAKLYVWNLSLIQEGSEENLLAATVMENFEGEMAEAGLIYQVDIDPETLEGTVPEVVGNPIWLLDFVGYKGDNLDPGAFLSADVEVGAIYTFSYEYCVDGVTTGTTVINAAKNWGMGSNVDLDSGALSGKSSYSITFRADYPQVHPVFQTHMPYGPPRLYVWNISLVKEGTDENLFGRLRLSSFHGELPEAGLVMALDIDPAALKPSNTNYAGIKVDNRSLAGKTWVFDFAGYTGQELTPNAFFAADVDMGSSYTFSFEYFVEGESIGTSVINAAQAWGMGSNAAFDSSPLQGKGCYSVSFTADYPQVYPVFECHIPYGAPKLYVWNMKLVKTGSSSNLLENIAAGKLQGVMVQESLVTASDVDTSTLQPIVAVNPGEGKKPGGEEKTEGKKEVWLLNFGDFIGSVDAPNVYYWFGGLTPGKQYTFSFDYCVDGVNEKLRIVNGQNEWQPDGDPARSQVAFTDNLLQGKNRYSITFTADLPYIVPAFWSPAVEGTPNLYVWNLSLTDMDSGANLFADVQAKDLGTNMEGYNPVSTPDVDPEALKPGDNKPDGEDRPGGENKPGGEEKKEVWLLDFSEYSGTELDLSAYLNTDVEIGAAYTFSFRYCVDGKSTGTTIINAGNAWGAGSGVAFEDNVLTGKGTYTTCFMADQNWLAPVFGTHTPYGMPKLYIWDIRLVKDGTDTNLLAGKTLGDWIGNMKDAGLISTPDVDPDTLEPPPEELPAVQTKPVWVLDFEGYSGTELDLSAYLNVGVEIGATYTFEFNYFVGGESTGTTVINAGNAWGAGSEVAFEDNMLIGKGTYTANFTADQDWLAPVFQTYKPLGTPKLYVWDIRLVKDGTDTNMLAGKTLEDWIGNLTGNISLQELNPDTLN